MSEFTCAKGHEMRPSDGDTCKICGGRVAYMDGKSNRELAYEDKMYDARCIEEELRRERDIDYLLALEEEESEGEDQWEEERINDAETEEEEGI